MSVFFKTLGGTGIIVVLSLCFLTFVMLNVSITNSWTQVSLANCKSSNGTHVSNIDMWAQPRMGMCNKADAINIEFSDCIRWIDNNFWETYDDTTGSKNSATFAAEHTFPDIYDLMTALVVFNLLMWMLVALHLWKPDWIGRWITQLVIGVLALLTLISSLFCAIAAVSTPITDSSKWQIFYRDVFNIDCTQYNDAGYTSVGCACVAFISSLFTFCLVYFPTCGGRCGFCADVDFIPTEQDGLDKGMLSDGNSRKSTDNYVPPAF
jgi:hypothetical protein